MADEHFEEVTEIGLPAKLFSRSVGIAFDVGKCTRCVCLYIQGPKIVGENDMLESTMIAYGCLPSFTSCVPVGLCPVGLRRLRAEGGG